MLRVVEKAGRSEEDVSGNMLDELEREAGGDCANGSWPGSRPREMSWRPLLYPVVPPGPHAVQGVACGVGLAVRALQIALTFGR